MSDMRVAFAKLTLFAAIGLFLVPGVALWFTAHAQGQFTAELQQAWRQGVDADADLSAQDKADARARIAAVGAEALCSGAFPRLAAMRAEACAPTEALGQFHLARRLSTVLLALGTATFVLIAGLALLAYRVPRLQLPAFVGGWWSLRAISAFEIAAQGALLVWLSFWLTAFFLQVYFVKLIAIAGLLAAAGVFVAIKAIFQRVPLEGAVAGELLDEAQAPGLWQRIREFARQLGTAPPKQIVAGIDTNFFVTETPLRVGAARVTDRTLFVSLPLLRAIDRDEADAVLAHELAHFSGGDTAAGAALGPRLVAYSHYMEALRHNVLTILALHVLNLFRAAFELALSRESRAREFEADRKSARLTSPAALSRALIRVAAYANYRAAVEQELFAHGQRHAGSLRVADRVAQGLAAFAQSDAFRASMTLAQMPHPFDSHPPLVQRMESVGAAIPAGDFAGIVAAPPEHSWIELVPDAAAVEARLWQQYEAAFADEHEQFLAVRYEPANDAERAIVLKHFPDVEFAAKKDQRIRVTHARIETPERQVGWDDVAGLQYDDGSFGTSDTLTVTHPQKGALGTSKTTKLKLAIDAKDRERLKAAIGQYWQRHQVMRKLQAEAAAEAAAAKAS
jgi:Zn-dependent protease with chaperone function